MFSGARKAFWAVWDWTGQVDDYRGRIGVIVGLLVLIGGGLLLLLKALGIVNTFLAVIGVGAIFLGGFVLVSFLSHLRAQKHGQVAVAEQSGPSTDTTLNELMKVFEKGQQLRERMNSYDMSAGNAHVPVIDSEHGPFDIGDWRARVDEVVVGYPDVRLRLDRVRLRHFRDYTIQYYQLRPYIDELDKELDILDAKLKELGQG